MTDPDPVDPARPDPARPDTARPDGAGPGPTDHGPERRPELPEDVDAAFASIVAGWAADGAPQWPDEAPEADTPGSSEAPEARTDGPSSGVGTATPPRGQRPAPDGTPSPAARPRLGPPAGGDPRATPAPPPEDEHFVPPEPPPLPRLGLSSVLGLALLVIGVVLLAVPGLLGGPVGLGIVPGLLAMTAGLGWLVFGLRRHREPEDGPDDGAVL